MNKKIRKIPPKDAFRDAIILNNDTYVDYLERMKKICLSMFEWENLPTSMNARFLEMCLYYNGQAALLYDDNYGYINTMAADGGYINIYGLPTQLNCYSYRFNQSRDLYMTDTGQPKGEECILVMNNWDRTPTASTLELFALRLYEAERACDVNIKASKTPVMVLCDEDQRLTMKNLYLQYHSNQHLLYLICFLYEHT